MNMNMLLSTGSTCALTRITGKTEKKDCEEVKPFVNFKYISVNKFVKK